MIAKGPNHFGTGRVIGIEIPMPQAIRFRVGGGVLFPHNGQVIAPIPREPFAGHRNRFAPDAVVGSTELVAENDRAQVGPTQSSALPSQQSVTEATGHDGDIVQPVTVPITHDRRAADASELKANLVRWITIEVQQPKPFAVLLTHDAKLIDVGLIPLPCHGKVTAQAIIDRQLCGRIAVGIQQPSPIAEDADLRSIQQAHGPQDIEDVLGSFRIVRSESHGSTLRGGTSFAVSRDFAGIHADDKSRGITLGDHRRLTFRGITDREPWRHRDRAEDCQRFVSQVV